MSTPLRWEELTEDVRPRDFTMEVALARVAAAREAIKRFKFKPAMKAGEAVSTTITYNYTFLLD